MLDQLSVVVPVYNEEEVIREFHEETSKVLAASGHGYEIVYIDDGSSDDTLRVLCELRSADDSIAIVELSRNFGKEVALSAGLDHALGDAVIIIDADLQDPPELINDFLREWRAGYDVVYGRRLTREGETWFKISSAKWFYRVLNRISEVDIPENVGDFRLLSRRAVDSLRTLNERHRYMKGLYAWIGFPQQSVSYTRQSRKAGRSKWSYSQLLSSAIEGFTSFSDAPLKISTYFGITTTGTALLYGLYILVKTLFWGISAPSMSSLLFVILFLGGIQLICLGIIGEYLARTYKETKGRSLYIVKGYHPAASGRTADSAVSSEFQIT